MLEAAEARPNQFGTRLCLMTLEHAWEFGQRCAAPGCRIFRLSRKFRDDNTWHFVIPEFRAKANIRDPGLQLPDDRQSAHLCAMRDHDVLRLHSCQRTKRDAVRRRDQRTRATRPGASRRVGARFHQAHGVKLLVYRSCIATSTKRSCGRSASSAGSRTWKLELIEAHNPQWRDLWSELTENSVRPGRIAARSGILRCKIARGVGMTPGVGGYLLANSGMTAIHIRARFGAGR